MIWINKRIPFKGYIAMAQFPIIFVREDCKHKFTNMVENHEKIHYEQQKELGLIFYDIWYVLEYIIRVFKYGRSHTAYKNICFEREANANERNKNYIKTRKRYSFIKYI